MVLSIKIVLKKPLLLSSIDSFFKLYNNNKKNNKILSVFFSFILQDKPNHQYNTKERWGSSVGAMAALYLKSLASADVRWGCTTVPKPYLIPKLKI